jgi:hypothetical protein
MVPKYETPGLSDGADNKIMYPIMPREEDPIKNGALLRVFSARIAIMTVRIVATA